MAKVLFLDDYRAGVPDLKIRARSFDEALEKARLRDSQYCGGYVADDE